MKKLNIAISSYRSAPFGGGQGIFVYELSKAFRILGHNVDIISGPPYPNLEPTINLIKSPGLDLFNTFVFRERLKIFFNKKKAKTVFLNLIGKESLDKKDPSFNQSLLDIYQSSAAVRLKFCL